MSKTNYLENKILDHVLGGVSYSAPATVYLALFTSDPGETGSMVSELHSNSNYTSGYSRQAVSFGTVADGVIDSDAVIDFGPLVTTGNITITHAMLVDSGTNGAGNGLYFDPVAVNITVTNGKTIRIPIGDLDVTET